MYIPTMALQTRIFLLSIGLGFVLGILYDVFYIIRLFITKSKYAIYIQDVFYLLTCSFVTFIFILALSSGEVRGYIIIGEILGWLIYYFSTGFFVVSFATKFIYSIKKAIKKIFLFILKPFKWFFGGLFKQINKIFLFFNKKIKRIRKKSKMRLKYSKNIVYNKINIAGDGIAVNEENDKA